MTWKMPNEICLINALIKKTPNKTLIMYSSYAQIHFTIWLDVEEGRREKKKKAAPWHKTIPEM